MPSGLCTISPENSITSVFDHGRISKDALIVLGGIEILIHDMFLQENIVAYLSILRDLVTEKGSQVLGNL